MTDRYAHCTFCGARFTPGQPWPRHCAACGETSYLNPKPVAVALQPINSGLLLVRRNVPPHIGELALPGGYIDVGETWQEAAARELFEETGVLPRSDEAHLFDGRSAPDGTLLIFALFPPVSSLPPHEDPEVQERVIITAPEKLAFDLHTQVTTQWFTSARRGWR